MLVEMFASRSKTLVFPFAITADSGEKGQNAGLVTTIPVPSGFIAFAFIYVGF